ncbi:hypothetical protein B0T11DRAFT_313366 [Plectosphaerella cucumerina]|uniref:Uncharacterized protein n=1 Tax=Plectosphaerella cucumerina TaxID=40658 RepID=A0A8K0TQR6_9PEZI|nr:hypothetical protein B0T11DRAFT_313366 [Plectosphaerella cucumerina]
MSKFFRSGDDSSDSSSEDGLESYIEESSYHDSDEARENSDDSDEGGQDSDGGMDIPDDYGEYWHFSDTDTDSESEDERGDGATAGFRPICQWRGSRLMNYTARAPSHVPSNATGGFTMTPSIAQISTNTGPD